MHGLPDDYRYTEGMARNKHTATSIGTREVLILVAERLIAEHGIDGVSLRQINAAAGQRNSSAAHYHFGNKPALIASIYDYRLNSVNQRRSIALKQLKQDGRESELRGIVETIIYPVVREIEDSEGGRYYIRFLAQAIGHPQNEIRDFADSSLTAATTESYQLLHKALPDINDNILGQRFGLMWEMTIHSLADRERQSELHARSSHIDTDLFIRNLIDMISGGLAAPVSEDPAQTSH